MGSNATEEAGIAIKGTEHEPRATADQANRETGQCGSHAIYSSTLVVTLAAYIQRRGCTTVTSRFTALTDITVSSATLSARRLRRADLGTWEDARCRWAVSFLWTFDWWFHRTGPAGSFFAPESAKRRPPPDERSSKPSGTPGRHLYF